MGYEIERKFLIRDDGWRQRVIGEGEVIRQGYLVTNRRCTVRVRRIGTAAYLTLKGAAGGLVRLEYEYPIPAADADDMLARLAAAPLIEKTRYRVAYDGSDPTGRLVWEVDVFAGANAGLTVAEIELAAPDQAIDRPPWLGAEVSHDRRYLNAELARRPFTAWSD